MQWMFNYSWTNVRMPELSKIVLQSTDTEYVSVTLDCEKRPLNSAESGTKDLLVVVRWEKIIFGLRKQIFVPNTKSHRLKVE